MGVEVKTTYTVEEFADYLANSVLRDSAEPLGWGPLVPATPPAFEVRTVTSNNNATPSVLTVPAIGENYPAGTTLVFDDGTITTTINDEAVGATTIEVNSTFTTNQFATHKVAFFWRGQQIPVRNPKFLYVVDEALRLIGLEDIELVNADNIQELRIQGRLELLRRIAANRIYQYDYVENYGTVDPPEIPHSPADVTRRLLSLINIEEQIAARTLAFRNATEVVPTVPEINIPEEANSSSEAVVIRW